MNQKEKNIIEKKEQEESYKKFYKIFMHDEKEKLNNRLKETFDKEEKEKIEQKKFELALKVAGNMLRSNVDIPTIISITGLTLK